MVKKNESITKTKPLFPINSNLKKNSPAENTSKTMERSKRKRLLRSNKKEEKASIEENPQESINETKEEAKMPQRKSTKQRKNEEDDILTFTPSKSNNLEKEVNENQQQEPKQEQDQKDMKRIENEIQSIFDKIALKKANAQEHLQKKRPRSTSSYKTKNKAVVFLKKTAKDFNYHLTRNNKAKHQEIIQIEKAVNKATDILLAIFELTLNSSYYQINYSPKSNIFWEQVVQYEELKQIFCNIPSNKLKEYWKLLSAVEIGKLKKIIISKESFLNHPSVKLKNIVIALSKYFEGKITNIEKYIKNIQIDIESIHLGKNKLERENEPLKETEIVVEVSKQPKSKKKTKGFSEKVILEEVKLQKKGKTKQNKETLQQSKQKEDVSIHNDDPDNDYFNGIEVEVEVEVEGEGETKTKDKVNKNQKNFKAKQQAEVMQKRTKSQDSKQQKDLVEIIAHYKECNNMIDDKKQLLDLIEKHSFIIKIIDNLATFLMKEFKKYSKDYIIEIIISNSCNLAKSYLMLRELSKTQGKTEIIYY